jgi:hypothetical protein
MRRTVLILVVGIVALVAVPAIGAVTPQIWPTKVTVTPGTGGPRTTFHFRFRTPASTGVTTPWGRADTLSVSGPKRRGCVGGGGATVPLSVAGTMMRVTLNPAHLGGRWCTGTFQGEIVENQRMICSPAPVDVCPQLTVAPQVVARFTFRVSRTS